MRTLTALLLLICGLAARADQDSYVTRAKGAVGPFVTLLARECGTVYYLPKAYAIDAGASQVTYIREVKESGNSATVTPRLRLHLSLRAGASAPDADAQAAMQRWAEAVGGGCVKSSVQVLPYPSAAVRMEALYRLERKTFSVRAADYAVDGSLVLDLDVDPLVTSAADLLADLDFYDPEIKISLFELQPEIELHLRMNYSAAAGYDFDRYTEKVCYERERCLKAFGVTVYCTRDYHCDEIPRAVQYLKELVLNQRAELTVFSAKGVPEERVEEARNQLMSRYVMSRFQEKSRTQIDGVTTVTLGEMKKETGDVYEDEERVDRIEQSSVRENVSIRDLGLGVRDQILKAYANEEVACLKRWKPPFAIDNPCFKRSRG